MEDHIHQIGKSVVILLIMIDQKGPAHCIGAAPELVAGLYKKGREELSTQPSSVASALGSCLEYLPCVSSLVVTWEL